MKRFLPTRSVRVFLTVLLALCLPAGPPARAEERSSASGPQIYVVLWFDTEDYLLPADDDATLHLCKFLSDEGVRATFKLVGEKARVLEKRGRNDVIVALQKHEIGYHSDFHSVQPTPALFMSRQGWDDGVAEFDRRERQGMFDVGRITGQKPSCYGQPGSSWGPQQFGAMRQWGMPVYLDAGSHVQLNGDPFWYCGILNLYGLKATLRTSLGGPQDLEEAKKKFDKAYDELLAEGGGPVSIYYHPCEFVHKQFWDGVNFSKGANPPRSEWKIPPQKTPEESRVAYETFEGYIRFIKSHANVQFVTARDALELYRDQAQGRTFTGVEISEIANHVLHPVPLSGPPKTRSSLTRESSSAEKAGDDGIGFLQRESYALSAAEILLILNQFALAGKRDGTYVLESSLFGPTQAPPKHETVVCDRSQLERTIADVASYMDRHGKVPNTVWIGSAPVSPESYMKTLARGVHDLVQGSTSRVDIDVRFTPINLQASTYVSDDNPKLWGWVIFPPGFKAPEMMDLAKRQAWTLKPALLAH